MINPIPNFARRVGLCLALLLSASAAVAQRVESPFAMCSNPNYRMNPAYPAALYDAGARMARLDVTFGEVRKQPGNDPNQWDWSSLASLTRVKKANPNTDFLILLGYSAAWAEDAAQRKTGEAVEQLGVRALPPESPANLYGHYVYETVRRYKHLTRYWESWNEPDLPGFGFFHGNGKDFFPYQKACYLAAKKADPNCVVLFAAMCYGSAEGYLAAHGLNAPSIAPPQTCFFEEYLKECVKDPDARRNHFYFDVMNQHSYSRASDLYDYAMIDRKMMQDYLKTQKPLWMTEIGFPDAGGIFGGNADDYCDYTLQSFAWGEMAGVEKFFHFQLDNSNGHGLYAGMLDRPKPVLTTYRDVLTKEFTGAKFIRQCHGSRGVDFLAGHSAYKPDWKAGYNLFEFRGAGGKHLWIAFADTDQAVTIKIPALTKVATAIAIDRHNNRTRLRENNGGYEIVLPGATNRAGWPLADDAKAKALGQPEHLVGGATVVLVE